MAVDPAAFIIRHKADLFQHFLFNSDGHAFYRHKKTPLMDIFCVYFMAFICYYVLIRYTVYL